MGDTAFMVYKENIVNLLYKKKHIYQSNNQIILIHILKSIDTIYRNHIDKIILWIHQQIVLLSRNLNHLKYLLLPISCLSTLLFKKKQQKTTLHLKNENSKKEKTRRKSSAVEAQPNALYETERSLVNTIKRKKSNTILYP